MKSFALSKWVGLGTALVLIAGLLTWLGWSRHSLKEEVTAERAARQQLQAVAEANQTALKKYQKIAHLQQQTLIEREQAIHGLQLQQAAIHRRWQKIKHDKTIHNWATTSLPTAVRELLQ